MPISLNGLGNDSCVVHVHCMKVGFFIHPYYLSITTEVLFVCLFFY